MKLFEKFGLSNRLQLAIKKLGFKEPTQIQEKSISLILAGKDVICESATGSGKTLAFGCGIAEKVNPNHGLQALVLTPTRELAEQVKRALIQISYNKNLEIISIYGGVSINPQIYGLTKANVVVATPGRLLDHIQRRTINTSKIKFLVLDEADRMFDMGFMDDIKKIIRTCPTKRQTLLFSATILPHVKKLANQYMKNPIYVSANKLVDPRKLKQVYYDIPQNLKLSLLLHLLKHEKSGLVMVFCNSRKTTDIIFKNLKANKIDAVAIHGGFSQNMRTRNINLFNKGKVWVLVCTDVASRGLHIDNVSHIYNYDIPRDPNDYVHRIGRTARAGEDGKVINLLCNYDYKNFSMVLAEYRSSFSIEKIKSPYLKKVKFLDIIDRRKPFRRKPLKRKTICRTN
ncbi:MAG: DEAD/DEAH box helicase [Candidatus Marinimicrobia bacterium]|nr:DEAD/DEAH box helicase [Candidatus Neomarinimicrobiota bacterium]